MNLSIFMNLSVVYLLPLLLLNHLISTVVLKIKRKESKKKTVLLILLTLIVLSILVYLNTVNNDFLEIEDILLPLSLTFGTSSALYAILNIPVLIYLVFRKHKDIKYTILKIVFWLIWGFLFMLLTNSLLNYYSPSFPYY